MVKTSEDIQALAWTEESNIEEESGSADTGRITQVDDNKNLYHQIKKNAKAFVRNCSDNGIPSFVSYYFPGKGYHYKAAFPEEIGTPEVASEFGKFKNFLKVIVGFNKADYQNPEIKE